MTLNTGTIANGATKTGTQNATGSGTANYTCSGSSCTIASATPPGVAVSSPISATPFIGSGTLTLFAAGNFTGSISGTGFTGSLGGNGSETVTIQYDYSYNQVIPAAVTPEPISMALAGGGLIALGLLRKRRKSFYEKDSDVKINRSWAPAPSCFAPDPASIRTLDEPRVWGSVLFEVQSVVGAAI
jgi:hypothetical protein